MTRARGPEDPHAEVEYHIDKELSSGGQGSTYLATNKRDNAQYVIKHTDLRGKSRKDKTYARQEVRTMRRLGQSGHKNIVRFYDALENAEETDVYIVMEKCEKDLYDFI